MDLCDSFDPGLKATNKGIRAEDELKPRSKIVKKWDRRFKKLAWQSMLKDGERYIVREALVGYNEMVVTHWILRIAISKQGKRRLDGLLKGCCLVAARLLEELAASRWFAAGRDYQIEQLVV
ncbi:hypothetical protein E3N88_23184 [Mikania micrantha]|uniref:Uncharacterized protein n=1 Tax=Mikania micrantha TaxID=192012 RepID=A0A5N6NE14_9ASTR|nr:hypothetical protein E3N88_23184 [Mikania micrantha]